VRRSYSGAASETQLTAVLNGTTAALTIDCEDLSNYPTGASGPFYIVVDRNQVTEEKILCSSRTGNTITVYSSGLTTGRGADGTTVMTHSIGASVEHVFTATDADEANAHVNTPNLHITVATSTTRPAAPVAGQTILQTDTESLWSYIDGEWVDVSGQSATGGGNNMVFWENDTNVTEDYTITSGKNAGTWGPVTIDSGVTVTVPDGSTWTVA
jgi:hypothetical protein